jgi:hypothetical protein
VVLEANREEGSTCLTSPVTGSWTRIGLPEVPVATGFRVRLPLIVVVANIVVPLAVRLPVETDPELVFPEFREPVLTVT